MSVTASTVWFLTSVLTAHPCGALTEAVAVSSSPPLAGSTDGLGEAGDESDEEEPDDAGGSAAAASLLPQPDSIEMETSSAAAAPRMRAPGVAGGRLIT
ncbi:hypothetical protein GCM10027600_05710 [Nocardioides ginsengisegetis]